MSPPKNLADSINRFGARLEALRSYLEGDGSANARVANAPVKDLEQVTQRAREYWDKLEQKRESKRS